MKKIRLYIYASAVILIGLVATLNNGCGKKESSAAGQSGRAIISAEKTSFNEVTSQLDPGGNFYLYLGTEQWLDGVSGKVSQWRQIFTAMPNINADDRANIDKVFDVVTRLIKDSGVEDVSGVGMSSIALEKGFYHNKSLVYHYPGKGSGFLWTIFGKQAHPLTGLDFLPTNTVMACCSDADLPLAWSVLEQEINQANLPQAQDWLAKWPDEFEQRTQIKWDQFLASLGGEFELVVTFDESKKIPVPLPSGERLDVPEPALLLITKVNDDTIFNRIDAALKDNSQVTRVDRPGLKMRTMPVPLPLPIQLRPTIASSGGYLFIGSSDTIVQEALAVKGGQKPGLQSTKEFKHLAQDMPQDGNQFSFVSQEFGRILFQVQKQMLALQKNASPAQTQWMQSLIHTNQAFYSYTVAANTAGGWLTVGNGNRSAAQALLIPLVAVPAALSAIAIPNFVKARETAQRNACINNLRQIDAAKQQWALEKGKQATDVPTWDDLKPYLGRIPHCPAGGTYTINAVDEPPQCSVPGHVLPP